MHGNVKRQLRETVFTAVIAVGIVFSDFKLSASELQGASQELKAIQLLEAAAGTQGGIGEQRAKMEGLYAGLAAKYPQDVPIKNAYAAFLWNIGEHSKAEELWKEAEKLDPENGTTQHGLATVALASGNTRHAASCMAKACLGVPENATYHFEFANVLFLFRHDLIDPSYPSEQAVIARALKHYAEACRLAPLEIEFARGYAETFYSLPTPDWPAALSAWQHLLKISPQKDFALANLASIYLKLGRKDEARASVEQMRSPEFSKRKARLLDRIKKE